LPVRPTWELRLPLPVSAHDGGQTAFGHASIVFAQVRELAVTRIVVTG
jgi:hypothetical protein